MQMKVFTGDADQRAIDLDPQTDKFALNMCFYNDNRLNNVFLRFDYSFT